MTDYNNGDWWGWNGGERPETIHPRSRIEAVYINRNGVTCGPDERSAGAHIWKQSGLASTIAFRVVKAYREPREFWVTYDTRGKIGIHDGPVAEDGAHEIIHVREVRDDA